MSVGYDDGRDYRQRSQQKIPEYSTLIYPNKKNDQKVKIAICQQGIECCDEGVKNVFKQAVEILKSRGDLAFEDVSLPIHTVGSKAFSPFIFMGAFGSMVDGCGFGTGVSGN